MTEKAKQNKIPEITLIREEKSQMAPVTGVFGTLRPDGGQITFFYDTAVPTISSEGGMTLGTIERHTVLETHMSAETFVLIAHWMMKKTEELERFMEEQKKDTKEPKPEE
ncbi:MAG: hypothetical protein U9N40_10120 [Euryarchaeota archaeon]|nr:hypothetical protein [Euryarchaeota archaeon]